MATPFSVSPDPFCRGEDCTISVDKKETRGWDADAPRGIMVRGDERAEAKAGMA